MDWTPLTQVLAIIAGIAGVNFWIWKASVNATNQMQKESQNAINQMQKETHNITNGIREDTKESARRYDAEFQETRKLWAELLQKISNK